MKPTPLNTLILKILKSRDKQSERLRLTGTSVDKVKVIDMSIGGAEKEDNSKWMPPDQKYRPNNDDTKWMAPDQRSRGNKNEKRKLTDIDIQINPDQPSNKRREDPNRQKQEDSLLPVVLRILICILVIDLSIWGYFKFVKGVSFTEGIASWQTSVREFLNFKDKKNHSKYTVILKPSTYPRRQIEEKLDHPKLIVKQEPVIDPGKQTNVTRNTKPIIEKYYLYKIALINGGKIEGVRLVDKGDNYQVYSKEDLVTEVHKSRIKNIEKLELLNAPHFETKFTYHGGTILVPVMVSHNGHREQIRLILDTGCGITQIHPDVVKRLKAEIRDRGKATIADGRKIDSFYATVDSLEVGPFTREQNFTISTNYIEDKHGIDGLLGMNFLRKHPFDIDKTRQVIIWK